MTDPWRTIDGFLATRRIRFGPPTVAQTTGGGHAPNSLHYVGRARDYGRSNSDLAGIIAELLPWATGPEHVVAELFGLETYVKAGRVIEPSRKLYAAHQNHVHVGLRRGTVLPVQNKVPPMLIDNPDLPNIEGPLQLALATDSEGTVTAYAIFSTSTAELHGYGPGWRFFGRSEDLTPD